MMLLSRNCAFMRTAFTRAVSQSSRTTSSAKAAADSLSSASNPQSNRKSSKSSVDSDVVDMGNTDIITRTVNRVKAPQPIVKDFFAAKVDRELLAYPEVLSKEDLDTVVQRLRPISKHFATKSPTATVEELLNDSQNLKLFAGNVPESYGGHSYFSTEEYLSMEAESVNTSDALILNSNRQFIAAIREFGDEELHQRFLRKLGRGELIGTVALLENGNDVENMETKAELIDSETNEWVLKGEKDYVINAQNADYILVAAKTDSKDFLGDNTNTTSFFIVETQQAGVTVHPPKEIIGCDQIQQSRVTLKKVIVAGKNVVGDPAKGDEIVRKLNTSTRIQAAVLNVTQMKKILNYIIQQCIHEKLSQEKLSEMESIKNALARAACSIYATESMIYMTSSLPDLYENPDIDLETAALKVFSQQKLLEIATLALEFLGADILNKGEVIEQAIRDAVQMHVLGEPCALLKLYIGTVGLQHCGSTHFETIKKQRNPLFHPEYIMKKLLRYQSMDKITYKLDLLEHLHPSFDLPATHLERSIARLHLGCDILLASHGTSVMKKQIDIMRVGDSAIELYALFCSVARASRSYCIGLRHAEQEFLMSACIAHISSEIVLKHMSDIEGGANYAYDNHFQHVADKLYFNKEYFFEHPLSRNF